MFNYTALYTDQYQLTMAQAYFIDGHKDEPVVAKALAELAGRAAYLKVLGSYPVAVY